MTAQELLAGKRSFPEVKIPKFTGKRVLVTGACGTIGSAVYARLKTLDCGVLVGLDHNEWQVAKNPEIKLGEYVDYADYLPEPDYVFHCAAFKHVKLAAHALEAFEKNNWLHTALLAEDCEAWGGVMVLASSDKAAGRSWLGQTKYRAEQAVVRKGGRAVRLVNVVSSSGSVVELWKEAAKQGFPLRVVFGAVRYWMQISEAVDALLVASRLPKGVYAVECPMLPIDEVARALGTNLIPMTLDPEETLVEGLVRSEEHLLSTEYPWLKTVSQHSFARTITAAM